MKSFDKGFIFASRIESKRTVANIFLFYYLVLGRLLEEVGLSDIFDDEADHPEKENPSNNNDRTVIVGGDEISNSKISQQA